MALLGHCTSRGIFLEKECKDTLLDKSKLVATEGDFVRLEQSTHPVSAISWHSGYYAYR